MSVKTRGRRGTSEKKRPDLIRGHLDWFLNNLTDIFGMRYPTEDERQLLLPLWREELPKVGVEAAMKWFYASLFSFCIDNECPPGPDWSLLHLLHPVSRIRLFVKGLVRRIRADIRLGGRKAPKALCRAATLLNLKKGSPSPSKDMINKTLKKHCLALASRHSLIKGIRQKDADPFEGVLDNELLSAITKVVKEVFHKKKFKLPKVVSTIPSMNGHYGATRMNGGAVASLIHEMRLVPGTATELQRMSYHPKLGVLSTYGEFDVVTGGDPNCDDDIGQLKAEDLRWQDCRKFRASPCAIREPLKVRVVTSGPVLPYYLSMPLQKFLWRSVGSHPTFELITKPISEEVLNLFFEGRDHTQGWCSGDYSAATDNLRASLTLHCWNEICSVAKIDPHYRRLGAKALVGHRLAYENDLIEISPKEAKDNGFELKGDMLYAEQKNGQLMGSPLSFPILCLINAAVCQLAYEKGQSWGDRINDSRLRDLPIMVNGDDCLMNYSKSQYDWWKVVSSAAGLEPSIGKTYFHNNVIQMNSTNFWFNPETGFHLCPFVNVSLLTEFTTRGCERRHWSSLGSIAREFKRCCGTWVKDPMRIFLARHKNGLLSEAPSWINWEIPEHLGGLGIPLGRGADSISYAQRQLASSLYLKSERGEPIQRFTQQKVVPKWALEAAAAATKYSVVVGSGLEDPWGDGLLPANLNGFLLGKLREILLTERFSLLKEQELAQDVSHRRFWKEMKEARGLEHHRLLEPDFILRDLPKIRRVPDHLSKVIMKSESFSFTPLFKEFDLRSWRVIFTGK